MSCMQRKATERYDDVCGRSPEIPWYSVGCLPSGAVHVTRSDVTNPETHRDDVTEQFLHPVPSCYSAGVFSHYVF